MYAYLGRAASAAWLWATVSGTQSPITSSASACPTTLVPSYAPPVVGAGYAAQLIANNLQKPRGILFDSKGALLVVQQGGGIVHLTLDDLGGTCLSVSKTTSLINNTDVSSLVGIVATRLRREGLIPKTNTYTVAEPCARAVQRWQDALCIHVQGGPQMGLRR